MCLWFFDICGYDDPEETAPPRAIQFLEIVNYVWEYTFHM